MSCIWSQDRLFIESLRIYLVLRNPIIVAIESLLIGIGSSCIHFFLLGKHELWVAKIVIVTVVWLSICEIIIVYWHYIP